MKIGYACLTLGVEGTQLKNCIMRNANDTKLYELIGSNLKALDQMLEYNYANNIRLFRISSDLIPFGSSPVNQLQWWELFRQEFEELGFKIKKYGIRVSMHPGQYTVLNSPEEEIVDRAILDLIYHTRVLDCLQTGPESKIVLHVGGIYNDKAGAMERFAKNYERLSPSIKQRLVLENDDRSYTISDVLKLGRKLEIPVVFDNLHHNANLADVLLSEKEWINECKKTWRKKDGTQKIHYSQQEPSKKVGSHSNSIQIDEFLQFYKSLERDDIDIMLEVKDKNLSAIKCINCTSKPKEVKLNIEWDRYKYNVLEKSFEYYEEMEMLLQEKDKSPIKFYRLLEQVLSRPNSKEQSIEVAWKLWDYLDEDASIIEKQKFLDYIKDYHNNNVTFDIVKKYIYRLITKYQVEEILNSYFFLL